MGLSFNFKIGVEQPSSSVPIERQLQGGCVATFELDLPQLGVSAWSAYEIAEVEIPIEAHLARRWVSNVEIAGVSAWPGKDLQTAYIKYNLDRMPVRLQRLRADSVSLY